MQMLFAHFVRTFLCATLFCDSAMHRRCGLVLIMFKLQKTGVKTQKYQVSVHALQYPPVWAKGQILLGVASKLQYHACI